MNPTTATAFSLLLLALASASCEPPAVPPLSRAEPTVQLLSRLAAVELAFREAAAARAAEQDALTQRWRDVLQHGWTGPDAGSDRSSPSPEVPNTSEPADEVAILDDVLELENAAPLDDVDMSEEDEALGSVEPDAVATSDGEAAATLAELDALRRALDALGVHLVSLEERLESLELENRLLSASSHLQREQLALLQLTLAVRATRR